MILDTGTYPRKLSTAIKRRLVSAELREFAAKKSQVIFTDSSET